MSEHVACIRVWMAMLCGIAIVAAFVALGPHLLAASARAVRPFGGAALRSRVWIVIAFAAYAALTRAPQVSSGRGRR